MEAGGNILLVHAVDITFNNLDQGAVGMVTDRLRQGSPASATKAEEECKLRPRSAPVSIYNHTLRGRLLDIGSPGEGRGTAHLEDGHQALPGHRVPQSRGGKLPSQPVGQPGGGAGEHEDRHNADFEDLGHGQPRSPPPSPPVPRHDQTNGD